MVDSRSTSSTTFYTTHLPVVVPVFLREAYARLYGHNTICLKDSERFLAGRISVLGVQGDFPMRIM